MAVPVEANAASAAGRGASSNAGVLPRRDDEARAQLAAVGAARAPVVLARDRTLEVPGALAAAIPTVARGSVIAVGGALGAGATATAFGLAAAATARGEWAALVDGSGSLGPLAAAEMGVDLGRFAVVRDVAPERWATVVAALLDGITLVIAELPRQVRPGDARRLVARARERSAVLVTLAADVRAWPVEAAVRITADGGAWRGLGAGAGMLELRTPRWTVVERGRAPRTVDAQVGADVADGAAGVSVAGVGDDVGGGVPALLAATAG